MSGVDTTARQHGILADFRAAAEEKCAGLKDDLRVTDDRYVPKKFNIEVKKWKSRKGAELMAAFVGSWPEQNPPISEIARLHYIFKGAREKEVAEVIAKGWREQLLKRRAENQPEPNTLPADPAPPLDLLPDGSWLLDVPFTLKSDLICRDDASA